MEVSENGESREFDIKMVDFPFICRICLRRGNLRLFEEEHYLFELFLDITNVLSTTSLPQNVCHDCIRTLEDMSLFIGILKSENKLRININGQVETTELGTSRKHMIKSEKTFEEEKEDSQYSEGFEICRICSATRSLIPFEDKAHLVQLFQNVTDIAVTTEEAFSMSRICNECINKLENISLFINVSSCNEIKLLKAIERKEALETENCLGNTIAEGYQNDEVKNDIYESKNLHTIVEIKEEVVAIKEEVVAIKEEIDDIPKASVEHCTRNGVEYFSENHSEDCGPSKDESSTEIHLKKLSNGLDVNPKIQSGTSRFQCDGCDKTFSQKKSLKNHSFTHTGKKPFECSCCGDSFSLKQTLKRHLLTHTGEKLSKCDYCQEKFTSQSNLKNHMLIHAGEKLFGCDSCGKRFTHKSNLQKHNKLIHLGEKPFECDSCGKRFAQKWNLRQHVLVHSGEKPFKCDCCQKSFTQNVSLQQHMLIHSEEEPFKCDLCGKSFTCKINLKRHLLTHVKERPFKCGICEKSFARCDSLELHILNHTGEKPFECFCCQKRFNRKGSLQQHMLIHSGEQSFKCGYCEKTFNQKSNMQKHMLVHEKYQIFMR